MAKRFIDVNLKDKTIAEKRYDLAEMEKGHTIYEVVDCLVKLSSYESDRYFGEVYIDDEYKKILVSKNKDVAFIDDELVTMENLIKLITGESEEVVLARLFDLDMDDFAWYVVYENGTIAIKESDGRWYTYAK